VVHLILDAGAKRLQSIRRNAAVEAVGPEGAEHDADAGQESSGSYEESGHERGALCHSFVTAVTERFSR